jgi:hypothetical protein
VKKTKLDIKRWTPVFTPIPLNIAAEVDLDLDFYVAVAVEISLVATSKCNLKSRIRRG